MRDRYISTSKLSLFAQKISMRVAGVSRSTSQRSRLPVERHTARGRQKTRPRQVDEHGAAATGDSGTPIMVNFYNDIIEMIDPCETVTGRLLRPFHRPVIVAVGGIFRPGVIRPDPAQRQGGPRRRPAIGAPPHPDRVKSPARRAAVAFAFVGNNARAAKRRRNYHGSGNNYACASAVPGRPRTRTRDSFSKAGRTIHWSDGHGGANTNGIIDLLFYIRMLYFAAPPVIAAP